MSLKKWFSGRTYDTAAGRESRSAFIAMAAFWICAIRFLVGGFTVKVGAWNIVTAPPDAASIGYFLAPCLALYGWRRSGIGGGGDEKIKPETPQAVIEGPVG